MRLCDQHFAVIIDTFAESDISHLAKGGQTQNEVKSRLRKFDLQRHLTPAGFDPIASIYTRVIHSAIAGTEWQIGSLDNHECPICLWAELHEDSCDISSCAGPEDILRSAMEEMVRVEQEAWCRATTQKPRPIDLKTCEPSPAVDVLLYLDKKVDEILEIDSQGPFGIVAMGSTLIGLVRELKELVNGEAEEPELGSSWPSL